MSLILETKCEHEIEGMHPLCNDLPGDPQHGLWCFCPGNQRREATIEDVVEWLKERGATTDFTLDWDDGPVLEVKQAGDYLVFPLNRTEEQRDVGPVEETP